MPPEELLNSKLALVSSSSWEGLPINPIASIIGLRNTTQLMMEREQKGRANYRLREDERLNQQNLQREINRSSMWVKLTFSQEQVRVLRLNIGLNI